MKLYIVDAFTDTVFGGNPAGVALLEAGQDWPAEEVMLKTAAELRYSETAFVRPLPAGEYELRYFTPVAEVELCGHATIGTFCALRDAGMAAEGRCKARTLAGVLDVELQADGTVMMGMAPPVFIQRIEAEAALERLYGVMGAEAGAAAVKAGGGGRLYPGIISTGLPDIILPVESPAALAALKPDMPALSVLSEEYGVAGVHAFAPGPGLAGDGSGPTAYCRNFAPLLGIDEEAATGTASGALTYYLYRNALIGGNAACVFIQGQAMGRPSEIRSAVQDEGSGESPDIRVGGHAAILVRGDLDI